MESCSDSALEELADVLLDYVSNRIWHNVAGDIVTINEVFESSYFTLDKHVFSDSLKVYLHFQSGEQAFSIGKKYFELARQVDQRWLDVIKAAIELDVSLSIEENLLRFLSKLKGSEIPNPTANGELEFLDQIYIDRGLAGSAQLMAIQCDTNDISQERDVQNRTLSLSNTEIVIQDFEDVEDRVKRELTLKNVSFSCSTNLMFSSPERSQLNIEGDGMDPSSSSLGPSIDSYLFTSSRLLLQSAHILSVRPEYVDHDDVEEDESAQPIFILPLTQSPDSSLLPSGLTDNSSSVNRLCLGLPSFLGKSNMTYSEDIDDPTLNKIIFRLPVTNVSALQSEIKMTDLRFRASILNSSICHHVMTNCVHKPSFSLSLKIKYTLNLFFTLRRLQDLVPYGASLFFSDRSYFLSEREDHLSPESLLCQTNSQFFHGNNMTFIVPSWSKYLGLSSCFLSWNFSQSEQIYSRYDDSLRMMSEFSDTDCSVSVCQNSQRSGLNLQCLLIHNSRDIGYLSYFRSLPLHMQRQIMKNYRGLPCSKDFSKFSTSVEKFQYWSAKPDSQNDSTKASTRKNVNRENGQERLISSSNQVLFAMKSCHRTSKGVSEPGPYSAAAAESDSIEEMLFFDSLDSYIRTIIQISYFHIKIIRYTENQSREVPFANEIQDTDQSLQPGQVVTRQRMQNISPILQQICEKIEKKDKMKIYPKGIAALIPSQKDAVAIWHGECDLKQEMRCLNLMIYFLEELFDIWAQDMVSISDAEGILRRLFEQLKLILVSITEKKGLKQLSDLYASCIKDMDASFTCSFDPIYVITLLRSILHKLNIFGKYISFIHIVPVSLKYSLYKLFLHYKSALTKRNQTKLRSCEIEISAKPEILESLFNSKGSDRRIKFIENMSKSRIKLQPAKSPFDGKRLLKVYQLSYTRHLNVPGLISMISKVVNNSEDKIHLSYNGRYSDEYDGRHQKAQEVLGEVNWATFKYI